MANEYVQVYDVANEIVAQQDGLKPLGTIDATKVMDLGKTLKDLDWSGQFNDEMAMRFAKMYIDSRRYEDIRPNLMADGYSWGIITQWVTIDQPAAIIDEAYEIQDGASVDQYVVKMPKAKVHYYAKEQKWVVQITRFKEQLKSVFDSAEAFERFWSAVDVEVRNAIDEEYAGFSYLALDTAIAQTVIDEYTTSYATNYAGQTSTKAINLLKEYKDANPLATTTVATALQDKEFIRFANLRMRRAKSRLRDFNRCFNIEGRKTKTPDSMLKYFIHSDYVSAAASYLYSGEFNKDDVFVPQGYEELNRFQAIEDGVNDSYDFGTTSAIDIVTKDKDGNDVNVKINGVIAVMMDKYSAIVFNELEDTLSSPMNAYGRYLNIFHHMSTNYQFHPDFNFIFFYIAEPEE